ncbi:MAG: lysylphosphatidylglycerol synthase transmembrane domain-containing protein [candidate division KSB1 bacterium]|nr:lysylphosphatidylglycerol synthase transmembrane domain-containing protein [candidate division KSB1 bacterium]
MVLLVGVFGNIVFSLMTTEMTVWDSLNEIQFKYVLLAALLALVPWLTNTLRVMIWTRFLGKHFSFTNILKIIISTDLGSAISPTAIGGGYVKAGMLIRNGLSVGASTSLMTLGSVEDGLFFMFAIPASIIYTSCWDMPAILQILHRFKNNIAVVAGVAVLLLVLLIYIVWQQWKQKQKPSDSWLSRLYTMLSNAVKDFLHVYTLIGKTGKLLFALSMLLTAVQWICRYSVITALLISVGIQVDPVLLFLFQWVTFSLMTFIPTPGAAAGAEASFYFVYMHFIPHDVIGLMTAGWRFFTFYFHTGLGVLVLGGYFVYEYYSQKPSKI